MATKVSAPRPDFESMVKVLRREQRPQRVYNAELYIDEPVKATLAFQFGVDAADPKDTVAALRRDMALAEKLGYDLVRVHLPDSEFRMDVRSSAVTEAETKQTSQGYTVHEHAGPIQNWQDLETYPWPDVKNLDLRPLEWAEKHMPEGMKGYDLTAQFFECSSWLMGYESLFIGMYEEPELVEAVLERIAEVYLAYTELLCQFSCIGVIWGTDDMGFKTQTLVRPQWLIDHIIPLHKKAADIARRHGKLYFLHSCGKVEDLMESLICDVGIDAKHSFEDAITPVEEFHERYGKRIGVVGGLDVDFLSRGTPEEVRTRARKILDQCHADGGYLLGSGNSITSYVPTANYLAMLEAGWSY